MRGLRARRWLPIGMLAAGAGLLVGAGFASAVSSGTDSTVAGQVKQGGTLRLSKSTDVDYVDPALAYFTDTFGLIGSATCAKLYTYPDKPAPQGSQIIPEVAAATPTVSTDGTTYRIKLKKTYRFHNGKPVTAANFVTAFNRNAHPKMQSPAYQYLKEIAGAEDVFEGRAKRISGISAPGKYLLRIHTTEPVPDLTARLTMPFFCPVRVNEAIKPDGIDNPLGSGPYYVAERTVNRQLTLLKNRFYTGPRPANVDKIVWTIGLSLEACRLNTERNETDYCVDGIPPTAYKEIAEKYGVNRKNGQFFFHPTLGITYFAINHDRPWFKDNVRLKKAINYAIDRRSLVRANGFFGGIRTDQLLPPTLWHDAEIYPLEGPDLETARALASGHMPPGNKLVLFGRPRGAAAIRAQLLQFQLKQIGIDLEIRQFARGVPFDRCQIRGEAFDLCERSWLVDYADGAQFFDPLLNGRRISLSSNTNVSFFDDREVNRRIAEIAGLQGQRRRRAWANLDVSVMRTHTPIAPFAVIGARDFVSSRVGCYLFHPVWGFDLAAACIRD